MDWDDVRHFLTLARLGSVRAAGAALGTSHSTVARRVEALEAQLGARLFDRSRDGYTLTDAGREVLPTAEAVAHAMLSLERGVVGRDERLAGPVTLTCSDRYISELLVDRLAPFREAYPAIEWVLTIDARARTARSASRRDRSYGLAVDGQPPAYLIGQRLVPVTMANYVAVAHAERLDPDRVPLDRTRWLAFAPRALHDELVAGSSYPDVTSWGGFSSMDLMVQGALAGLGVVMLPTYVGDRLAGLQRLGRADLRHLGDFWLLSHPDLRENARLRVARAHVAAVLRDHARLFAGVHEGAPV